MKSGIKIIRQLKVQFLEVLIVMLKISNCNPRIMRSQRNIFQQGSLVICYTFLSDYSGCHMEMNWNEEWIWGNEEWIWRNELLHLSTGKKIEAHQGDISEFRKKQIKFGDIFWTKNRQNLMNNWVWLGKGWEGTKDDTGIGLELMDTGVSVVTYWKEHGFRTKGDL